MYKWAILLAATSHALKSRQSIEIFNELENNEPINEVDSSEVQETLDPLDPEMRKMMNGWEEDDLIDFVEHNGYWFFICNVIDDAWTRC